MRHPLAAVPVEVTPRDGWRVARYCALFALFIAPGVTFLVLHPPEGSQLLLMAGAFIVVPLVMWIRSRAVREAKKTQGASWAAHGVPRRVKGIELPSGLCSTYMTGVLGLDRGGIWFRPSKLSAGSEWLLAWEGVERLRLTNHWVWDRGIEIHAGDGTGAKIECRVDDDLLASLADLGATVPSAWKVGAAGTSV